MSERGETMAFEQAIYFGNDKILKKLAKYAISKETFEIIEKIGSKNFLDLIKDGQNEACKKIWQQYIGWFRECPDSIKNDLREVYGTLVKDDNDFWLETCARIISFHDLEFFTAMEPEWYKKAPKEFKTIMDEAFEDPNISNFDLYVDRVYSNYIYEAIEVAIYAKLI